MVAMVWFSLCSSTSTFPGTSTVNWKDCIGLASTLKLCSGVECTCSSSTASLLIRMTICSLTPAFNCSLVGVTLPSLIVTSTISRAGGACSFDMSDGPTADGWLLDVFTDTLSELFDPPQPAVIRAAARSARILEVVTGNHLG